MCLSLCRTHAVHALSHQSLSGKTIHMACPNLKKHRAHKTHLKLLDFLNSVFFLYWIIVVVIHLPWFYSNHFMLYFAGMSREVENLIQENVQLLETK